jgi:hypothetical protein
MLSDEAIQQFIEAHRAAFGEDISEADAKIDAEKLLRLFDLIYKPIRRDWPIDRGP